MQGIFRTTILLCLALTCALSGHRSSAATWSPVTGSTTEPHLTLSVAPAVVPVDGLVTLQIAYHGIGLYHTTVTISPESALVFDPPRAMPCRFDQDASRCTTLTLRAWTPGLVTIRASASGEIYDSQCQCWRFSVVSDDGPAQVSIGGSRLFVPLVQR